MKASEARPLRLAIALAAAAAMSADTTADDWPPLRSPVPCSAVAITSDFWSLRQQVNREKTIPHLIAMCEREGRVRNMLRAAEKLDGGFEGNRHHDADLFKVIEAASWTLTTNPDPRLEERLDKLISAIVAAQRGDGYLHTYAQVRRGPDQTPTALNLFAAGHLIHAGVTHHQATGKSSLLDAALRMAGLIRSQYGPGQKIDVPSHPILESALVRLAEVAASPDHLELAAFFIDQRGQADQSGRRSYGLHGIDSVPLRQLEAAEGHVIASLFLFTGMYDVGVRRGDRDLLVACRRMFDDSVTRRMYLTGAMGRQSDERFTEPFDLVNRTSIGEGCQSAALIQFSQRLLSADGDSRFADVIERVMYNNLPANVGLEGTTFYYHNRLSARWEDATGRPYSGIVTETDRALMPRNCLDRQPWFKVPCCPPNVAMAVATVGQLMYAVAENAIYVHQYLDSHAKISFDGRTLSITQQTRYPWEGRIAIRIEAKPSPWQGSVHLRIPDWCRDFESTGGLYRPWRPAELPAWSVRVNGEHLGPLALTRGYVVIDRQWNAGDLIELHLPMPILQVRSHPAVEVNRGRIALQRGPVVYCIEAVDHGGRTRDVFLPAKAGLRAVHRPDFLGGVTIIEGTALRRSEGGEPDETLPLRAVPYAVWANRQIGEMDVWLPAVGG